MKTGSLTLSAFIFFSALFSCYFPNAQTVASIWNDYKANPYNHPNIPNNSYSGYRTGTVSIPTPSYTIYNVTSAPYNAVAGDGNDDQPGIQAAIDAAGAAGSGIVYIPTGTYTLNKPIYIKYNNVIVRGQGSTGGSATILDFRFSMYSMFKTDIDAGVVGPGGLWWATGLVWIGPANSFKVNGAPDMFLDYEHWRTSGTLATVTAVSNPGTFTLTVNSSASLAVGMKVLLRYQMPSTRSLIKHIYGHTPTEAGIDNDGYVGDCTNIKSPGEQYYIYPAQIQQISGNTITLDRPLRLKVDPATWPATLDAISSVITESGVENIQIKGHNATSMGHLVTPTSTATSGGPSLGGWNGLYINRSWNCWANNIRVVDMDCGVIFSAARNCSVLNSFITSSGTTHWYHHPFAYRVYSSDNLVENFTIDGPSRVYHGINAEWYSSGNVYSKGLMKVGTFDSHRAAAFDMIRTEITVSNDNGSAPGGAATSGPFAGKRFAHWNITQQLQAGYTYQSGTSRNGNDVYEPLQFPMGVFVGISGPKDNSNGEFEPPPLSGGNLGSIDIAGSIADPALTNLYQAQLALRMSGLPIHMVKFDAKKSGSKAHLTWTVAEPTNDDKFSVQWSTDGTHFTDIASMPASERTMNYQYDHSVPDWGVTNYYRIKIITIDGSPLYSTIKSIRASQNANGFSIYPNPVSSVLTIELNTMSKGDLKYVRITNLSGQAVKMITSALLPNNEKWTIDVRELAPANYYIEFVLKDGIYKKAFIKL